MLRLQLIKWINTMIDNSDIPLPSDELKSRVLVFAITDEATHQYEEITKGYVELTTDEDDKNLTFHYLEVKDQKSNEVLMRSNLKLENNFGKQKGSIISWTDEQQPQYPQIALSFQKDRQCDMFWRTICQKVGKSYLQISGSQKLQSPNPQNLNYILQKAKNSIDLVDYNIVHSKGMMKSLRQVFYEMKNNNDEMGMGTVSRIINAMMFPTYSSNAIQTLLTGQNFFLLLDLQYFKKNINFRDIYQQKVARYLNNKFSLPQDIFEKIELSHRATFYRENVLNLGEQAQLQSIMFMICKQALVQIMSYLNRSKFLDHLINLSQYPNSLHLNRDSQTSQTHGKQQLQRDKIHFIHEALIMYQQITSEQIKMTFKQNIYSSGILKFVGMHIERNDLKALQILFYINEIDKIKLFDYLIQDFKHNSTDNLMKTLMKKYIHQFQLRSSILALVQSLTFIFNQRKEFLDFFNGTFVFSVFSVAKDPRCALFLSNILLSMLQNSSVIISQIVKSKICYKLATQYRSGACLTTKVEELQLLRFLKHIIVEQSLKSQPKSKDIEISIIQSGYFDCCLMIYFKHSLKYNLISSSMLENLRLIQKMDYSQFDAYLIKEYSDNQLLTRILQPMRKKHVQFMNKKLKKDTQKDYIEVQRMVHEEILENQQQDSYLMNDQAQHNHAADHYQTQLDINQRQKTLLSQTADEIKKQNDLKFLKRMMDEFNQSKDEEEIAQKQGRKMVKKQQDSKLTAIQFAFDLPDMDQVGGEG